MVRKKRIWHFYFPKKKKKRDSMSHQISPFFATNGENKLDPQQQSFPFICHHYWSYLASFIRPKMWVILVSFLMSTRDKSILRSSWPKYAKLPMWPKKPLTCPSKRQTLASCADFFTLPILTKSFKIRYLNLEAIHRYIINEKSEYKQQRRRIKQTVPQSSSFRHCILMCPP